MVVQVAAMTGWSRDDLLGMTVEELRQWRDAAVEVSKNAGGG